MSVNTNAIRSGIKDSLEILYCALTFTYMVKDESPLGKDTNCPIDESAVNKKKLS